jgi:hypothetical protein
MTWIHWTDWTNPEGVKVVIDILTLTLAVLGFVHGIRAYSRQKTRENDELARRNDDAEREGRLKRFEKYQQMQSRYRHDHSIQTVFRWLYPDQYDGAEAKLATASTNDKLNFMGFYEELAIMVNSKIMIPEAAYYTFGVDAVEFWEKEGQWRYDPTWKLFNSFVHGAQEFHKRELKHFYESELTF